MKKTLVIFLSLLLAIQLVSAVEFNIKDEFMKGETLIATVSGNFLKPVLEGNVFFYKAHVRVAIKADVAKINDEYYISAMLPEDSGNYSLVIENVEYYVGSQVSDEDLIKYFSITNNTADFSVDKGFVITSEDFYLQVQNLQDKKITIDITGKDSIELKSGEIDKIYFKAENQTLISLSSDSTGYNISVSIFSIERDSKKQRNLQLEPSELKINLSTNTNKTRTIYLYNTGKQELENIILTVSNSLKDYISLSTYEIDDLKEDSHQKIEIFVSSQEDDNYLVGQITAKSEDIYAYSAIFLNYIQDYIPEEEEYEPTTSKTCAELGGKTCKDNEKCNQDTIYAKDNVCCLGNCEEIPTTSSGKIIGWAIVAIVILLLYWFFKNKYRGAKKSVNLLDIAKGR